MTPKGANLEGTDLLEVSTLESGSYVTRSITGQEIIDAAASSGGVTDITTNAPLATTGGTTPDLSISEADGTTDGYLTAVDWSTFNSKQSALVSGTNIKTINSTSVLGSGNIAVQAPLTLTTTGTSGAATLVGSTLNVPQYSGGGASAFQFKAISSTQGTSITGIVGSAISSSVLIPAGTLSNSFIDLVVAARRQAGTGTVQLQVYLNTTNSLTGATLFSSSLNFTSNNWNGKTARTYLQNGNTLVTSVPPSTLQNFDFGTPATPAAYTYNSATDNLWVIFAMNNGNTDNVSFTNGYRLLCY